MSSTICNFIIVIFGAMNSDCFGFKPAEKFNKAQVGTCLFSYLCCVMAFEFLLLELAQLLFGKDFFFSSLFLEKLVKKLL